MLYVLNMFIIFFLYFKDVFKNFKNFLLVKVNIKFYFFVVRKILDVQFVLNFGLYEFRK